MPQEDVQQKPLEGPGSQTPVALPSLHTPKGQGADATGVNNVGKSKGLPGAPSMGGDIGGAGLPGSPGALGGGLPEVKTPEDLLVDRSNDRLSKDLEDVYLQYYQDKDDTAPKGTKDINNIDFDYVIDRLINQKGWHVDRLKELIPSRDEKAIKEYFNKILNSNTSEKVDVDQQKNNVTDMFNNSQGSNDLMNKAADLTIDNGAIKIASANSAEMLDQISFSIGKVRLARKQLKTAFLTKVGFEAIKDFANDPGMDEGIEMGMDMPGMPGMPGMEDKPSLDVASFGEGLGGDKDLKGLVDAVKSALDELTAKVEEFGLTSDTLSSDDMLKGDALMDKASDEMEAADSDLDAIDTFESKSKEKKEKPEKKENSPFGNKDEEDGEKKEEGEKKVASAGENFSPEGGKKVSVPEGGWEQKGGKGEGSSQEAMTATTGGKSAYLNEIKEKLAVLKQAREISVNKKADYPYNDLNKQEQTDVNADTAKSQAAEINSDMSGGFQVPDESLGITGEGNKKDPGMAVSEPADIKKAAVEDFNKVATAANSLARKAVSQAVAKTRVAMEVSGIQQLKGLLANPLRDELVSKFAEYGVDKEAAKAIVHNAFLNSYEDSQKIVIAEAFDVLSNKDDNEFIKVASFTKDFKGAGVEEDETTEEASEDILKEASAEAKTVKTASLRGSQVSKDSSQEYTGFWSNAYREGKGL